MLRPSAEGTPPWRLRRIFRMGAPQQWWAPPLCHRGAPIPRAFGSIAVARSQRSDHPGVFSQWWGAQRRRRAQARDFGTRI